MHSLWSHDLPGCDSACVGLRPCTGQVSWPFGCIFFTNKHWDSAGFKIYFHHKATVLMIFLPNEISNSALLDSLKTPPSPVCSPLGAYLFLPEPAPAPLDHVISNVDKPKTFPHQTHPGLQQCGHQGTPFSSSLPITCAGDMDISMVTSLPSLSPPADGELKPAAPTVGS